MLPRDDEESLNWSINLLSYIVDEDINDELSATVKFGTADVLFEFDGNNLAVKLDEITEF
jgi:hypothetical protein